MTKPMKRAPLLLYASVLSCSLLMQAVASNAWRVASTKLSQDGFALTGSFSNDITLCELPVTFSGQAYDHLLCHCVLPHSNWEWATPCLSESLLSCKQGLQEALHR